MLQIEIAAKKHHKSQYLDAVTSQLLYFQNVKLYEVKPSAARVEIPVRAEIMYEDDMIVLAKNSKYSKPHMILNGVNYGYINFEELELEQKLGNIGIKVNPDLVDINPSRESLIWNDKTRDAVVKRFSDVVSIAEDVINSQLNETDFIKWLKICAVAASTNALWGNDNDASTIGRLAKIVDMSKIELRYPLDKKLKFNYKLMDGIRISVVTIKTIKEGSKTKKTVDYSPAWRGGLVDSLPIYLKKDPISNRKTKFILQHLHPQGFILINLDVVPEDGSPVKFNDITSGVRIDEAREGFYAKESFTAQQAKIDDAKTKIANLHNYILASAEQLWYESIVVPPSFDASDDAEEIIEEETTQEAQQSAADRRKLTGATIIHTPRMYNDHRASGNAGRYYEMQKVELPVHLVDTWANEEIFWSNNDSEPLLHTAALITRQKEHIYYSNSLNGTSQEWLDFDSKGYLNVSRGELARCHQFLEDSPVRLLKIAQQNVKYYRDFKHIHKFFREIKNKTITMSNALIRWNTARLLDEKLEDLNFLAGFASISMDKYSKYSRIKKYVTDYWRSFSVENKLGSEDSTTGQLVSHLDKVGQFQLFVRNNPNETESIVQLAQQLFNNQEGVEINNGCAIDTEIYDIYLELIDWCQPVKTLLNIVEPLVDATDLNNEQEEVIRGYLDYRGVII